VGDEGVVEDAVELGPVGALALGESSDPGAVGDGQGGGGCRGGLRGCVEWGMLLGSSAEWFSDRATSDDFD